MFVWTFFVLRDIVFLAVYEFNCMYKPKYAPRYDMAYSKFMLQNYCCSLFYDYINCPLIPIWCRDSIKVCLLLQGLSSAAASLLDS